MSSLRSRLAERELSPPFFERMCQVADTGATLTERYHAHETVGKTLEHAVREFGREGQLDPSKQYILVLNATPLEDQLTLEAAGVRPGDVLNVRSKSIPGDGNASGVL